MSWTGEHTETSLIIRNGNPNLESELPSGIGHWFTGPFTNNCALRSTRTLKHGRETIAYFFIQGQCEIKRNRPQMFCRSGQIHAAAAEANNGGAAAAAV